MNSGPVLGTMMPGASIVRCLPTIASLPGSGWLALLPQGERSPPQAADLIEPFTSSASAPAT